jgi:hypothetical protein
VLLFLQGLLIVACFPTGRIFQLPNVVYFWASKEWRAMAQEA